MVKAKRLSTDERRQRFLELGLTLFGASAYEDVSIERIAEAAGVSKGLLYHYFGSKRGYYVALVAFAADKLIEATQPDPTVSPRDQVRQGLTAYFAFVSERRVAYRALITGGMGTDDEVQAVVERARGTLAERTAAGLRNSGVDPEAPGIQVAVRSWIGAVEAASLTYLADPTVDEPWLIDFLSRALEALVLIAAGAPRG